MEKTIPAYLGSESELPIVKEGPRCDRGRGLVTG